LSIVFKKLPFNSGEILLDFTVTWLWFNILPI